MPAEVDTVSSKSRKVTALLAILLGPFGIHRMYLGRNITAYIMLGMGVTGFSIMGLIFSFRNFSLDLGHAAVAMIAIFASAGVWSVVDFVLALSGQMRDGENKSVKRW